MINMTREEFYKRYEPECDKLFTMINHIGPELNSRKNRFDKADLFEAGIEASTGGKLRWTDEIGYDLSDPATGLKYEAKSQANCLYTPKGALKKETTVIKLSNSLSQNVDHKPSDEADYLLILDSKTYALAIISYKEVLENYVTSKLDGFTCKIPTSALTFLVRPSEVTLHDADGVVSYAREKPLHQKRYVSQFF